MSKITDAILKRKPLEGGEVAKAVRTNILNHNISVEDGYAFLIKHGCHKKIACQLLKSAVIDLAGENDHA
tara:strand:+ start:31680 stop:31889 length:210 start_codon:yes stop_codon:yes gene_type:complete